MNVTNEMLEAMGFEFIPTNIDQDDTLVREDFEGRWHYMYWSIPEINLYSDYEVENPPIPLNAVTERIKSGRFGAGKEAMKQEFRSMLGLKS